MDIKLGSVLSFSLEIQVSHREGYDSPPLGEVILAILVPHLTDVHEIIGGAESLGMHTPNVLILESKCC